MSWEVVVTKEGKHWFSTTERSAYSESKAAELVMEFEQAFPEHAGFHVTAYRIETAMVEVKL